MMPLWQLKSTSWQLFLSIRYLFHIEKTNSHRQQLCLYIIRLVKLWFTYPIICPNDQIDIWTNLHSIMQPREQSTKWQIGGENEMSKVLSLTA